MQARPRRQLPTGSGIGLGRVFGVHIHVDWSLLIIFGLVTISLGTGFLPASHPDWTAALTWGMALAAAVLFFASVLAHELSHALVARLQGIPVQRVTLFLFGGMAHMESEPRSPKAEFLVAVVGPVVSIGIGLAAGLAGRLLAGPTFSSAETADTVEEVTKAMSGVGPLATLLLWLGPVNVILGVFNLVPGFPLDGGRVLRAFLWWTTGDLIKASRWASRAGQAFAWFLMAIGMWSLLAGSLAGMWWLLIGWFLNNAARMSYEHLLVRQTLSGVPVREIMSTRLDRVPPDLTARRLAEDYLMASDQRAFPVESDDGFLGLVCFDDVRRVPRERWEDRRAADLMTPVAELATLPPDAGAVEAVDQMARWDVDQIPVLENGRLLGLVRRRDILRWMALRQAE